MSRLVPVLLLLVLVGGGVWWMLSSDDDGDPDTLGAGETPISEPEDDPVGDLGAAPDTTDRDEGRSTKTETPVSDGRRVSGRETGLDKSQTVMGIVVSSAGGLVRDAEVYLIRDMPPHRMIELLLQQQLRRTRRLSTAIESEARTDAHGVFALGADPTEGEAGYELHIMSPGHVIHREKLRLSPKERKNLGQIRLLRGATLTGTVLDGATKQPIPGATVSIRLPIEAGQILPTPGTEDGIEASTDRFGRYKINGLPVDRPLLLSSFARGYGTIQKPDVTIPQSPAHHVENLELPKGFEIQGQVMNAQGEPVARARVEALPYSEKNPTSSHASTDEDGYFAVFGLSEGQYTVSAAAAGYVKSQRRAIPSGKTDLRLVLERQGTARVLVRQRSLRPVRDGYTLELKSHVEGREHYGPTGVEPVFVRSKDGRYEFTGINPGSYVFEVNSRRFAKTYSKSFNIAPGQKEPAQVDIIMNEGGTVTGRVVDAAGRGIQGVKVSTLDNTFQDNPFTKIVGALIPVKITKTTQATDDQGGFLLKKLTPGKYQLKFEHNDYSRHHQKDVDVVEGETASVGSVVLSRGGRIGGVVYCKGVPLPQAEVKVSSMPNTGSYVSEQAYTDRKGRFEVARPLPPGRYHVEASLPTLPNPFMKIVQMQESRQVVQVEEGRRTEVRLKVVDVQKK